MLELLSVSHSLLLHTENSFSLSPFKYENSIYSLRLAYYLAKSVAGKSSRPFAAKTLKLIISCGVGTKDR